MAVPSIQSSAAKVFKPIETHPVFKPSHEGRKGMQMIHSYWNEIFVVKPVVNSWVF
jgi:hypothetical protein